MLFISHSAKNLDAALDMQRRLLERGYDAARLFLDHDPESGIPAGARWEQVLYARLKDCRALIALCSPAWRQSQWCFAELVCAKAMGKDVFPVVVEACEIGDVAGEHQAVFVHRDGDAAYARLWTAMERRRLGPLDAAAPAVDERSLGPEMVTALSGAIAAARIWESGFLSVPHLLAGLATIPEGLLTRFLRNHSVTPETWSDTLRKTIKRVPAANGRIELTEGLTRVFENARRAMTPVFPEVTERIALQSIFEVRATYLEQLSHALGIPLRDLGEEVTMRPTPLRDDW